MPSVDEVRSLVKPHALLCAPGVTTPKNDVLYVSLKRTSDPVWYATLKYGATERAMSADEYKATVIDPVLNKV